jgi:MFS family permease
VSVLRPSDSFPGIFQAKLESSLAWTKDLTIIISFTVLKGLPADIATQAWAILLIVFGLAQSIAATLVGRFMGHHSANRIVAIAVWIFAVLILVVIILDASTGGTLSHGGNWTPWLLYPIYIGIGFCLGVVEVGRKTLPPLILGTDPDKLEEQVADAENGKPKDSEIHGLVRLNAAVHICYEVAGTAGAFLSTPLTRALGFRYALMHLPILFPISGILFWLIHYDTPANQTKKPAHDAEKKGKKVCNKVTHQIKRYFQQIWLGARIVLTHRSFNWLFLAFIVPQLLHRIFENLVLPIYFSYIVNDGTLQGLGLGGSNFGELCGAALVFLLAKFITNPLIWVASDAVAMNLMWVFPFLYLGYTQLGWAFTIASLMWIISGTWAAGDISTMSYIQNALPERAKLNKEDEDDVSPLGAVLGFLFAAYAVLIAVVLYLLGQFFRVPNNDPTLLRDRFIYVVCIPVSVIAVLIIINAAFARIIRKDNPDGCEHWRPTMCSCRRTRSKDLDGTPSASKLKILSEIGNEDAVHGTKQAAEQ